MTKKDFDVYVGQIVELWSRRLNERLLTAMAAQGLFNTGALQQSLRVKMLRATVLFTAQVEVSFNTYGRVLDMTNRPRRMPVDTNTIRRLALGVGSTRRDSNRKWYNTTWYGETKVLLDALFGDISALADKEFLNWVQD